jgi:DNA-binding NarL/FixJ family response regulator
MTGANLVGWGGRTGMTFRIAVVDPLPMFVRGVANTLAEAGHVAETPDDVVAWVRHPGAPVVLMTVLGEPDWRLLAEIISTRPDAVIIVMLPARDAETWVRALTAGAMGALPRDTSAEVMCETIATAAAGGSLLPFDVLRALVASLQPNATIGSARPVSDQEVGWLRLLAIGTTVARLAERAGYSERMMFRLLADVYRRLGASNRTTAIMRARDAGWF